MKQVPRGILCSGILVFIMAVQFGRADTPRTMSYQGKLTDAKGNAVADGRYELTFSLYDVDTSGSALWTETHSSVVVTDGIFGVILGGGTPLKPAFDTQYWLGISVNRERELAPRVMLTSSPYSLGGNFWSLTGNAGTSPGSNFLGTTDSQPLELHVNDARAFRLEPNATCPNIIGGHYINSVTSGVYAATISGGGGDSYARNRVTDDSGTVGGGQYNIAGDDSGTTSDKPYATVGGGLSNQALGERSTISGGSNNLATGWGATVAGGYYNKAAGDVSFAAGHYARIDAAHDGTFMFADSFSEVFESAAADEFAVRCQGGARFVTDVDIDGKPTKWAYLDPATATWSPLDSSDRDLKANIAPVDEHDILERLASITVATWSYRGQDLIRHIGPMAHDFRETFGFGGDEKSINSLDANGVALAAIQGLYELVKEKDARLAAQQQQISTLEARLAALEALVSEREGGQK